MDEDIDQSPIRKAANEVRSKWTKWFELFKGFWRTKQAVQGGISLHTWPTAAVLNAGYFGPWKFNAIATAITGGIAAITTNFLNLLAGAKADDAQTLPDLDPVFASLLRATSGWIDPFMVPILLTAIVYLMGWGSLRSKDSNAESRRRARAAYLYFDGAYGFFSRLFLAFGISLMATDPGQRMLDSPFSLVFSVGLAMAIGWQLFITARKVPRLLFTANGYSTRMRYFSSQRAQPNDPPWNKLVLANILGGWPLWMCVWLLLTAISYSLAWLLFWLRGLLI